MKVNPAVPDATIVIFGAAVRADGRPSSTLRRRVEAAAAFAPQFERPQFIPTGGKGRYGDPEAVVMARLLRDAGYAEATIVREPTGTDTLSSVRAVKRLVRSGSPVFACTSAYHLPRCLLLLRLAGMAARPCPPPRVSAATRWWTRWYWRLREAPALPYDALLMVWLRVVRRI